MAPTNPDATGSGTPGFISPEEMMGEIVTSRAGAKRTDVFRSVLNERNDCLPRLARDKHKESLNTIPFRGKRKQTCTLSR
jgi:hypothetical protein